MYEEFYGFKNTPFRLSPDPAFFFGSPGHSRALAYLRYGLSQKEGFIVITGSPGTGKTTLAKALLQEIGRDKVIVAELNTTHLDPDDVLRMVAASFGLEHESLPKATILKRLEAFFISRTRAGYHILLLVDEAQNLPYGSLEELRMLSNFYLGKNALIQIFLLGQEQFRNSLYSSELEQLRQRVVASSHLEPLTQTETREYIEHRLKLSGWNGSPKISDRAFARLFSLTKGVPRRINTFCERLLLFGALEGLTSFHDDTVKTVAKELMYEVSAKGVKLSDIEPGVPEDHSVLLANEKNDVLANQNSSSTHQLQTQNLSEEKSAEEKRTEENSNEKEKNELDALNSFSDEVSDIVKDDTSDVVSGDSGFVENQKAIDKKISDSDSDKEADELNGSKSQSKVQQEKVSEIAELNKLKANKEKLKKEAQEANVNKNPLGKNNSNKEDSNKDGARRSLRVVAKGNAAENQALVEPDSETPLDDTNPDWWELVALAVEYHRDPTKLKSIENSKSPVPEGIIGCFKIAIGKIIVPDYVKTGILAGVSDQELRDAIRYYIKNILLSNTADYYRRLGVKPSASFDEIRTHYKYLFRLFQPDKEQNASNWDETFTRRINQAYGTLRSTEKRKEYDEFLAAINLRAGKVDTVGMLDSGSADTQLNIEVEEEELHSESHVSDAGEKKTGGRYKAAGLFLIGALAIGGGALYVLQPDYKSILTDLGVPEKFIPSGLLGDSVDVLRDQALIDQFLHEQSLKKDQTSKSTETNTSDNDQLNASQVGVDEVGEDQKVDSKSHVKLNKLENDLGAVRTQSTKVPVKKVTSEVEVAEVKTKDRVIASDSDNVTLKGDTVSRPLLKPQEVKTAQAVSQKPIDAVGLESQIKPTQIKPKVSSYSTFDNSKANEVGNNKVKTRETVEAVKVLPVIPKPIAAKPLAAKTVEMSQPIISSPLPKASVRLSVQPKITEQELVDFSTDFSLAYEEGDIDFFMTYFAEDASTNDAKNKQGIRKDYQKLFSTTEMRVIDLDNINWKIKKQKAIGKGNFVLTVLGLGGSEMKKFSGIIKLEVVKVKNEIKLKGMFHVYEAE